MKNIMKKEQGFILPIIIVVVVVAVLGTAGYFLYKQYSAPKPIACTQEAKVCPDGSSVGRTGPNCEFAECPAAPDQTAGWKTYTNNKFKFKINYLNNLVAIESLDCNIPAEEDCQVSFSTSGSGDGKTQFSIMILGRPPTFSLEESAKSVLDYSGKDFVLQSSIINGQKTVFTDIIDEQQRSNESGRIYFFKKDTYLYAIFFPLGFDYSFILSSFTFIR